MQYPISIRFYSIDISSTMRVVFGMSYGCMCMLLSAWIVKSSVDATEISHTDELDNSVASIIGDGLRLTENDASESELGFNHSDQRMSTTEQPDIQSPAQVEGIVNRIQLVVTGQENKSKEIAGTSEPQSIQQGALTGTPNSTTTTRTTTDGRRIFGFVNPLLHLLTARNVHTVSTTTPLSPTTSTPSNARSVSVNISITTAGKRSNDVINSTIFRTTSDVSDHRNHTNERRGGIVTPPTKTAITIHDTLQCGYPPICDQQRCRVLNISTDQLENCEVPGAKGGFIFMIVLLALIIIVGNSMLPIIVWRNRDMRAPHNFMKVSLAAADAVVGLVLLFSVVPNVVRTMNSTEVEVTRMIRSTMNSPQAIIAGSMITLSAQASLFHLTYLSIERFVAIKWPMWHRFKAPGSLKIHIAMIWVLSIVAAFIPAAFPQSFTFMYQPTLFVYILTSSSLDFVTVGTIYLVMTMAIPFLISVILTAATGIVVWRKMRSTSDLRRYSSRNSRWTHRSSTQNGAKGRSRHGTKSDGELSQKELKPEVAVFKTTVIMIVAFCVTLLPFITVALLFYAGYLDCLTYPVPFASAFYACMSNSFINVLIYTARDRKFRAGWKKILRLSKSRRWMTGIWKSQRTKSSACASSVQMSQRPGHYAANTDPSKEKCERPLVKY